MRTKASKDLCTRHQGLTNSGLDPCGPQFYPVICTFLSNPRVGRQGGLVTAKPNDFVIDQVQFTAALYLGQFELTRPRIPSSFRARSSGRVLPLKVLKLCAKINYVLNPCWRKVRRSPLPQTGDLSSPVDRVSARYL